MTAFLDALEYIEFHDARVASVTLLPGAIAIATSGSIERNRPHVPFRTTPPPHPARRAGVWRATGPHVPF